ncbi:fructose-6-phosphate aldolase [Brevibacillus daliensis]|uniref:fructose-6-phosphate aldolase n=1 Tax=Brevibacillus daliensis TaxID=2892995 RepID=UPI001E5A1B17|nr:fructose-6-phosphate aldolase [Brevibacillus daliensis]
MIYMLDTANLKQIERAFDLYPMAGVTTNPSIIAKEKTDFLSHLKEIRRIIGEDSLLHAQSLGRKAEDIVEEALYMQENVGGNFYVKIPVIPEGIKAMKMLNKKGVKITATAIFTAEQAHIASVSGAEFVAPYVNRLDNMGANGVQVVEHIVTLFKEHQLDTKVLAASFKNVQQVLHVALAGGHSVTVTAEIMDNLLKHPMTDWSVDQFVQDWENVYGEGKLVHQL